MIKRTYIASLSLTFLLLATLSSASFKQETEPLHLDKLPELCDVFKPDQEHSLLLMISSAQVSPSWDVLVDGVIYSIAIDDDSKVISISTSDTKFCTDEGLIVGSTLKEVMSASSNDLRCEHGFGYCILLPSSWNAGIFIGDSGTDSEPEDSNEVTWFYKRSSCP